MCVRVHPTACGRVGSWGPEGKGRVSPASRAGTEDSGSYRCEQARRFPEGQGHRGRRAPAARALGAAGRQPRCPLDAAETPPGLSLEPQASGE